jgi:hypothetical protein
MSEEKEPHLQFREAVQMVTNKIGGNMEGFILFVAHEKGKSVTWFGGGPPNGREHLILHAAVNLIEQYKTLCDGDLAAALAVMNGEIAKRLTQRKQRGGI